MINFKQKELAHQYFAELKSRFFDIEFVRITESSENPQNVWVEVIFPLDDDRQIEIRETAADISTDILLEHGYYIALISAWPGEVGLNLKAVATY